MKKRALSLLMAVILVVSLLPTAVWAADGTLSGSGTEADPYLIASADDLNAFRDKVNAGDNSTLCAKLTQNIDLGNNSWTPIISSSKTYTTAYKGTFDGDYHTINGLKIDSTASNQGLFGAINGATIKNLKVNGSVTSSNNYIGGIVGKVQQGTIENCSFSGTVSTTKRGGYAGGITSYAGNASTQKATITGCANTASVKGGVTGGIAGYVKYTTIENCYNVGTITRMGSGSSDRTGGIVGQSMNSSSVSHCYNSGTISSTSSFGAICGWNGGKAVTNCFWTQPETGKGAGNSDINEGKVDSISASDLGDAFTTDASGNVILAWESSGADGYEMNPAEKDTVGTDVIMSIKANTEEENYDEYLAPYSLSNLIKKYSDYIRYPIRMEMEHSRQKPKPEDAGEDYKPEYEQVKEWETLNSMVPLWQRKKSEVTREEYDKFYQEHFGDFAPPQSVITVSAEGAVTYKALLFIPSQPSGQYYTEDFEPGLQLYSSGVMIMDKCADLLPEHFRFVRGVVDSQDLQLNISRETLQHNSQLRAIAKKIEKKITSELKKMRDNDREEYEKFFENFGRGLEFGIYNSYGMLKDQLADLLLFYSAKQEKLVTLDEYLEAAPADQKAIYYAAGESVERLAKMPIVKTVLGKGYDVLLCTKDVDEFCFQSMMTYGAPAADGEDAPEPFELKNVASGDLDLASEEEKKEAEETTKDNEALFAAMKDALGDSVMKVAVSSRLTDAPACITAAGPVSLEMERIMAQMPDGGEGIKSERVLEVNAKHAVFDVLRAAQEAGDADKVKLYAELLYNQALLVEGLPIEDPVAYANAVTKLMA